MNRRRFLGSTLATGFGLVSGCASPRSGSEDPPDGAQREVSVEEVAPEPDAASFELSIDVANRWVTAESTATLEATVTNAANTPDRFAPAYYKGSSGWASEPGVLLYSTQAPDAPPSDYVPPCFPDDGEEAAPLPGEEGEEVWWSLELPPTTELAPGESSTHTLLVVDDPTVEGCLQPGTYRFAEEYRLEGGERFDWTWSLTVEAVRDA